MLAPKPKKVKPLQPGKYPPIPQNGPLRWYDKEMRCASRGCTSPTYCKVEGVPVCMKHALAKLNDLVIEVTENRKRDLVASSH